MTLNNTLGRLRPLARAPQFGMGAVPAAVNSRSIPWMRSMAPKTVLRPLALAVVVYVAQAAVQPVFAQEATTAAVPAAASKSAADAKLGEVTVSASGLQLQGGEMATPVQVIDGEELVLLRESTWGATLANEPGIQASHFGAGASRPIIRGMDGPRVAVLSDGAELYDASTVSPDHAVTSEPMLATQVEVLRGPSALLYGAGSLGGVVNVLDNKIPTAIPEKGYEGSTEVRVNSAARERAAAYSLTGGAGQIAVHVEGVERKAGDYRVGSGWSGGSKVLGSQSETGTGSIGLSWIGEKGYIGLAYTRQTAYYGLPGHAHDLEGCHAHGDHLHCGSHDGHDHGAGGEAEGVPVVDLRSERWDLRGELRQPLQGIEAIRWRAGFTDYRHDEIEDGAISTTFLNRAHDARIEVQHEPILGWHGVVGLQTGQRKFSALGEEAYVPPTVTRKNGIFALEDYVWNDWRFQAALRHDWQSVQALAEDGTGQSTERRHRATSGSLGAVWKFTPGYTVGASLSQVSRLPTAEELYANGLHMATRTLERGNADLSAERARNIDLSLRKTAGDTTFDATVFHNRIQNYIYGRTLDAQEGVQLIQYSQADATFVGWEGKVRQRINNRVGITLFGDQVRARLSGGQNLPRVPTQRVGLRVDGNWQSWTGQVEWLQVGKQKRVAEFETTTAGYGLLNASVSYNGRTGNTPWQLYVKGNNLTNHLAFVNTSFIKDAAPLLGRNVSVGVKVMF